MCNTWFATNKHQNPHHISSINVSFPILCQSTDLHQLYSKIGRLLAFVVHIDFDVNSLAGRVTSNRYACHQMHRIRWTAATATTRYEHLVFFFHHRQLRRHTNIPTTIKSEKNREKLFFFSMFGALAVPLHSPAILRYSSGSMAWWRWKLRRILCPPTWEYPSQHAPYNECDRWSLPAMLANRLVSYIGNCSCRCPAALWHRLERHVYMMRR